MCSSFSCCLDLSTVKVWYCVRATGKVAPDGVKEHQQFSTMSVCDQCSVKFSLLFKKKKTCDGCMLAFCNSCIKRTQSGTRQCHKCGVLSQWPLDANKVAALRVKDLRSFLHSKQVDTNCCTEKCELIEMVNTFVFRQHLSASDDIFDPGRVILTTPPSPSPASETSRISYESIRVRPMSAGDQAGIRVRPMAPDDGIRVRAGASNESSPDSFQVVDTQTSPGTRVYPSLDNEDATWELSRDESGLNIRSPDPYNVNLSIISDSELSDGDDFEMVEVATEATEALPSVIPQCIPEGVAADVPFIGAVTQEAAVQDEACANSVASLPKDFISLNQVKNKEAIQALSVRQCKQLLSLNRVNYAGIREKHELVEKVEMLWLDYQETHIDTDALPEEKLCKICFDSAIDCVFLECGHMAACIQCGKQMSECPVCRQYVVRVVRTFRA